jgi:CTP:molybdopterin cytidylyltransferase MocA
MAERWQALVLAAGRGANDPIARAYGISHKASLVIAGKPMLHHVIEALRESRSVDTIAVSAEDANVLKLVMNGNGAGLEFVRSEASAPRSAKAAIERDKRFPVLITTGDHPLLTAKIIDYFCNEAERGGADFCVGLARADIILKAYPTSVRTFFAFSDERVSGCNLFAVNTMAGLKLLERWQYLEGLRKKPWRLVAAFGLGPLLRFAFGRLTLADAFAVVSRRLGLTAKPIFLPFPEAAIDVDKPADKELAEKILRG